MQMEESASYGLLMNESYETRAFNTHITIVYEKHTCY